MVSKISKIQIFIIGTILLCLGAVITFAALKKKGVNFPIGKFLIWMAIIGVGIAILGFVVWWAVSLTDKSSDESSIPKQYVDSSKAIEIWKEAFIVNTGIQYITQTWNENKVVPVNHSAVKILNEKSFAEPSGQTSDQFCGFEVIAKEGERRGTLVVIIHTDLGEEWIRKNWNWRIEQSESWKTYDPELSHYPLATSKDEQVRLTVKRMELAEDDFDERDLKTTIDPLIRQSQTHAKNPNVVQPAIKTPEIVEQIPELSDQGDNNDDDDISKAMRKYRNKNK